MVWMARPANIGTKVEAFWRTKAATSRTGVGLMKAPLEPSGAMPRRLGSFTVVSSRDTTSPGMPTQKKVSCQLRTSPRTGRDTGGRVFSTAITTPPMIRARPLPVV